MFQRREPPIVISVGGSLIFSQGRINTDFLSKLNNFIRGQVKKGKRFFLVSGGGASARVYRDAGRAVINNMTAEDLDWLGIHASRVNGHLLRTIFRDIAHPRIIENYDKKLRFWKEPVVVGAGWKPGWSTDYDAAVLARDYKASLIINMSNIDWVYDKDPKIYKDAKRIEKLTWNEMEKIVGKKWTPGLNAPFDPVAAQLCNKHKLTVIVANGYDFDNLERIINGDSFNGTVIMPFRIDDGFYDREYYTGKKGENKIDYVESFIGRLINRIANYYRAKMIKIFLKPKSCLDVGCGTGALVKQMRELGIDAYGVEISKDALNLAHKDTRPFLKLADITNLPHPDSQFDLVLTYDVLEHLERSKLSKAVEETARVAKHYVLHKIYTRENLWITWLHGNDFSHVSVFTKRFWRNLFSRLKNIEVIRNSFFRLPSLIETIFLLKKKN